MREWVPHRPRLIALSASLSVAQGSGVSNAILTIARAHVNMRAAWREWEMYRDGNCTDGWVGE
jgi:hypothetical protein